MTPSTVLMLFVICLRDPSHDLRFHAHALQNINGQYIVSFSQVVFPFLNTPRELFLGEITSARNHPVWCNPLPTLAPPHLSRVFMHPPFCLQRQRDMNSSLHLPLLGMMQFNLETPLSKFLSLARNTSKRFLEKRNVADFFYTVIYLRNLWEHFHNSMNDCICNFGGLKILFNHSLIFHLLSFITWKNIHK